MTATLRSVGLPELAPLASLHVHAFGSEAWSAAQIEGSLRLATTQGHGVWLDGRLVAFCLVQRLEDEAEILTICVDPDERRRGLARQLLRFVIEAQKSGAIFLEVAQDNAAAISLYESCGFQLTGRRPGYYRRAEGSVDALNYRYLVNA